MPGDEALPPVDPLIHAFLRRKARGLCGRCSLTAQDFEDLEQDLRMALVRGQAAFDPIRGPLQPYQYTLFQRAFLTYMKGRLAAKRHPGRASSLDAPARAPEGSGSAEAARRGTSARDPLGQLELQLTWRRCWPPCCRRSDSWSS